VIISTKVG